MLGRSKADSGRKIASKKTAQEAFREIGIALTSRLELEEVLKAIVGQIQELLKPQDSLLYLLDEERTGFVLHPHDRRRPPHRPVLNEGIVGWAVRHGKSVSAADGAAHNYYSAKSDLPVRSGSRAILCVPIVAGEVVRGAIEVLGPKFTRTQANILKTIADFASVAIENSTYVATIEELTITDDLTGLYNGRYLSRIIDMEIRRAQRYGEEFSIVFIDLDKFKDVNDKYGHLVGSRILKETGRIIADALRLDIDSAFRYGGDEFVMVLPNTKVNGAQVVTKRIQQIIRNRLFVSDDGERFNLTASFGIAAYPRDATSREEIVKLADEAMYEVKRSGRDGIALRSPIISKSTK